MSCDLGGMSCDLRGVSCDLGGVSCDLQGAEYVFECSWGEQLSTVVDPVPVVMSVGSEECRVLEVWEVGDVSGEGCGGEGRVIWGALCTKMSHLFTCEHKYRDLYSNIRHYICYQIFYIHPTVY